MASSTTQKGLVGLALMVVGTIGLLPGALPSAGGLMSMAVLPAAALLTLGTYLFGTDVSGRPV